MKSEASSYIESKISCGSCGRSFHAEGLHQYFGKFAIKEYFMNRI